MDSISYTTPKVNWDEFFYYKKSNLVPGLEYAYVREGKQEELMEYFHELERNARNADIAAAKKETNSTVELPQDKLEYLVSKYNPRKMSRDEYESFLQDMVDMGIITKTDTGLMDTIGPGGAVPLFTPGSFECRCGNVSDSPYYVPGSRIPMTYEESGGDILAWFSIQTTFKAIDPCGHTLYRSNRERSYGRVCSVLEQMDRMSPASRQTNYQQSHQATRLAFDLKNSRLAPFITV